MHIFEWCTLLKCSSKCPCTCILTAIINISNKIGAILTNCMSNECIHTHSNLAKSGIWSIDCEIWDMGYWGVKNLGYGILGPFGGKKIWDMGYWGVKNLGYGIWAPLCHPPPIEFYHCTCMHYIIIVQENDDQQIKKNIRLKFTEFCKIFKFPEFSLQGIFISNFPCFPCSVGTLTV